MILDSFYVGPLQVNCTILGDEQSGEAVIVDPGDEIPRIQKRLKDHGLRLTQILLTHAHIDHVAGAQTLKKLTGAPVWMHPADMPLLDTMEQQAGWLGIETPETAAPEHFFQDGASVGLERFPAWVLHTPGHSQGSVCLHFAEENLLIAGDTLFAGSVGRTDLLGGSHLQLLQSIRTRLLTLPDETRVIAGHGPNTTIGIERRSNPFLQEL